MLVTAALAGLLIGLALGLLGAGGSILAVPALVYVAAQPLSAAVPTSLLVVGASAAAAVVPRLRAGIVHWPVALIFDAVGIPATIAGATLGQLMPPRLQLLDGLPIWQTYLPNRRNVANLHVRPTTRRRKTRASKEEVMPGEQGKASTEYVSEESALAEHETWRRERWEEVSGPRGLAATTVLAKITESEQTIPGVPGHWSPPTAGSVRFTATSEDGVSVAGEPVDGTVELASRTSIEFHDGRFGIVGVYDGMGALTVWDPHAPTLTRLKEIATYPFDPTWIIDGEYVPAPADRVADVTRLTNPPSKDTIPAPGDIIVELNGERHRLVAVEYATGELLLVVFTDSTSGSATPGIGRWLILPKPEGSTVRLDFNRAIVPNHVFSDLFPCPLPPAGNHLPLRVEAGERGPVHADE